MSVFKKLHTVTTAHIDTIKRPASNTQVDLNSSAYEVFTNFSTQSPLLLEQSTTIDDAKELMRKAHVKLKLVINTDESFRGVVTMADLLSVKVMRAQEATGLQRSDLTVADIMTPKEHLRAISSSEFATASIGDILSTMENVGEQHVLIVDVEEKCISGIVSANDIARRLHVPVFISERAESFAEIYKTVHA